MKFSSAPDHNINIYCSMVCLFLSSWCWSFLEISYWNRWIVWSGMVLAAAHHGYNSDRPWLKKILVWIHFCSYQCKQMRGGFSRWTLVWFLDIKAVRQFFLSRNDTEAGHNKRTHCSSVSTETCFTHTVPPWVSFFFTERPWKAANHMHVNLYIFSPRNQTPATFKVQQIPR